MKELFFNTLWLGGIIVVILFLTHMTLSVISEIKLNIQKKKALEKIQKNSDDLREALEKAIEEMKIEEDKKNKTTKKRENKSK